MTKYYKPKIISLESIDKEINKFGVELGGSGPSPVDAIIY
jgi:hypothetical protein